MIFEKVKADLTVIGGGLAGVCSAIAAARQGLKVSLVQNRPVLGGNSSSEIRVWVSSATKHGINRYSRENGIMGELFVENQYRNKDGNPVIWDALLLEKVKNETNINLFLNTDVTEVIKKNQNKIESVVGWMQGAERKIEFISPVFSDCTGDGLVGYLAEADYVTGAESSSEYGESLAPDQYEDHKLGSTIFFFTKDVGHPVNYVAPSFAKNIEETPILKNRVIKSGDSGSRYWWIEWGGEMDIIHDNDAIQHELQAVIFGIWDYIKNSGKFEAENLTLEWVGSIAGKRESRRLLGDYVYTQGDVENQTLFEDRIGFGGWGIDLHPAGGMYAEGVGARHSVADGNYHVPYRILYSRNIDNLFMAGRNISASHIGLGAIRIMGTCALMGEAVGVASAITKERNCSPREVYTNFLEELQQRLLKEDGAIIGLQNNDPFDIARKAKISAKNWIDKIEITEKNAVRYKLDKDVAFMVPLSSNIKTLRLLCDCMQETEMVVEIWTTDRKENYIPSKKIGSYSQTVNKSLKKWVTLAINKSLSELSNLFFIIKKNEQLTLYLSEETHNGVLSFVYDPVSEMKQPELHQYLRETALLYWTNQTINRQNFMFAIESETSAYRPTNIINGLSRPYGGPNMWLAPAKDDSWIELSWENIKELAEIRLTFNDDLNEDLINLDHHYTPFDVMPDLIKNADISIWTGKSWQIIEKIRENRKRHHIIKLDNSVKTKKLRINCLETNGSSHFSLVEVRVYERKE